MSPRSGQAWAESQVRSAGWVCRLGLPVGSAGFERRPVTFCTESSPRGFGGGATGAGGLAGGATGAGGGGGGGATATTGGGGGATTGGGGGAGGGAVTAGNGM
eukprot:scaffold13142_cov46-Phaeocystis_antarctica.AAC.1